jgi:predicted acylesterase/phospholipase RssA
MKVKLVFSGSGTKIPLFSGALKRLEEEAHKRGEAFEIEAVIGTSGGSIIAAALASGMKPRQIIDLCKTVMPKLNDLVSFSFLRIFSSFGFVKGEKIQAELAKHFVPTLGQAKIPLFITTTNFDTEQAEIFSSVANPRLETARAVRASISIPVYFEPVIINGDMYIDGGVKRNFAIDFFKDQSNVVGLYFVDKQGRHKRPSGLKALPNFISRIINMLINAKTEDDIEDASLACKIPLRTNVNGLDFSFTAQEIEAMIKEGYDCTDKWIRANPGKLP